MISRLSHKHRFYLLMAGVLLLIYISYSLGFAKTLDLKRELEAKEEQLSRIQDAPLRLKQIKEQLQQMNRIIGHAAGEETSPYLIEKVGKYCQGNGLILYEIPPKHLFEKDGFAIATYQLVVKGSFKKLLSLLLELEYHSEAGKLRATTFESEFNLKKGTKELYCTYYIQSVEGFKNKE